MKRRSPANDRTHEARSELEGTARLRDSTERGDGSKYFVLKGFSLARSRNQNSRCIVTGPYRSL